MSKRRLGFTAVLLILFSMTIILLSSNSVIFGQSESMSDHMSADQMGGGEGEN